MSSSHRSSVRVRYAETDQMKVLHHAVWPVYWEVARGAFMDALGIPYGKLEKEMGINFPVISLGAEILAPAYFEDLIEIDCRVEILSRVRLRFTYEGRCEGKLLARGHSEHGIIDTDWRIVRLPQEVASLLAKP